MYLCDFQSGLRCAAAAILIFAANTALYDTAVYKKPYFRPACAAVFFLLVQSIYLLGRSASSWLLALCAGAAAAGAAWLRERKLENWGFLCGLALALLPVSAYGFSLGRVALMALLLAAGRGCRRVPVCGPGGCLGLLADLTATEPVVLLALIYGAGGAVSGLLRRLPWGVRPARRRRQRGLALLFGADVLPAILWECGAGAAIYALLPQKILPGIYAAGKRAENTPEPAAAAPMPGLRRLWRALYDSFFRGQQLRPPENPAVIFDRAAQEVCSGCVLRTDCWQSRYSDTYSAFNDASPGAYEAGTGGGPGFSPAFFPLRCVHFPALLQAIDRQTHDYLLRRQFHRQLQEARSSAKEQYACLSELLDQAAVPVSGGDSIGYRVSASLRPRGGEHLCGDQVDHFEVGR
ncbi:MAG: hypothetical protein ACLUNQ_00605 [Oscillospiraceae bacterium]